MEDILLRGSSMDGAVRVFAAITTKMVNTAQEYHHTYPVATAALGRTLTAAAIMGTAGLKNDTDSLTLQIKGDGPISYLVAVANSSGAVKGYAANPLVDLPLNKKGKLDVGGAVGNGYLSVIRDLGLKQPYIGQVPLVSGEIAEDVTAYYAQSEQIPSAVALGVLVNPDNSVAAAGGFMIQLMPEADDSAADIIEETLKTLPPVTTMIKDGMTCEDILLSVTKGFDMLIENKAVNVRYECGCTRERMERALISIGRKELREIIDDRGEAEICCQFCPNKYTFVKGELEELLKRAK